MFGLRHDLVAGLLGSKFVAGGDRLNVCSIILDLELVAEQVFDCFNRALGTSLGEGLVVVAATAERVGVANDQKVALR